MDLYKKKDEISVEKRTIGNNFFKIRNYKEALHFYQQSLVYADSKLNKALSYGNISAIYAALNDGVSAIFNIEEARKFHEKRSGDVFLNKLARRERECREMKMDKFINKFSVSSELYFRNDRKTEEDKQIVRAFPIGLPLSYPCNPEINGLVDRVSISSNSIYAVEDMKFGDVIAITKSLASTYDQRKATTFTHGQILPSKHVCSNCGITEFSVIFTCDNCIVRYCSTACKKESLNGFHSIECSLLEELQIFYYLPYLSIKLAYKFTTAGVVKPVKETSCFDWKQTESSVQKEYEAVLGFYKSKPNTMVQFRSLSAKLREVLTSSSAYKNSIGRNRTLENSLWETYNKMTTIVSYNIIQNSNFLHIVRDDRSQDFVYNIDWLHGLFRHSCKPNVVVHRSPNKNENRYILLTNVKAGDPLSIAYHKIDYTIPPYDRNKIIQDVFDWKNCTCFACKRNLFVQRILFLDFAITLSDYNISVRKVNSSKKLEKWYKAQLQEILVVSKKDSQARQLLIFTLDYLYPNSICSNEAVYDNIAKLVEKDE